MGTGETIAAGGRLGDSKSSISWWIRMQLVLGEAAIMD
jgi:hypothetical protein